MWLIILGSVICVILGILLSLFAVIKYINGNQNYWRIHGIPTLKKGQSGTFKEKLKLPFHEIDLKVYKAFKQIAATTASPEHPVLYGGQVELRKPVAFVIEPELIKHILVKDFDHFVNRRGINMESMDPYFHKMLFNMESQPWKEMRATMSPTFTTGKIKKMFDIFELSSLKFVKYLEKSVAVAASERNEIDMRDSCVRFTLDVIASTAFGLDSGNFDSETTMFIQMGNRVNDSTKFSPQLIFKFIMLVLVPKLVKILGLTFFDREAMDFFAHAVKKSIQQRESSESNADTKKRQDFLQLMLDAKNGRLEDENSTESEVEGHSHDKKAKLTDDLILAQCVLSFLAGLDTTESLLIFASYELALNPDVQEKLFEEIDETFDNNDGKLTHDLVNKMSYLDLVVSETLRKYPPVVRMDRRVNEPYKVPGSEIVWEKDTLAIIPVYCLHYDETIFPDPQKFIPERFTPENKATRHPYTYMPFGLGPRSCIAQRFALVEAKTAIAHLVHKFRIEPSSKTQIPMTFTKSTSLKPANGMWLNLTRRNN